MIGKADVEFYEANMVMLVANTLAGKPVGELSYRQRQRVLNKAVCVVQAMLNDAKTVERFEFHGKHK